MKVNTRAVVNFAGFLLPPVAVHRAIPYFPRTTVVDPTPNLTVSALNVNNVENPLAVIPFMLTTQIVMAFNATVDSTMASSIVADVFMGDPNAPFATVQIQPTIKAGVVTADVSMNLMLGNAVGGLGDLINIVRKGTTGTVKMTKFASQATWLQNMVQGASVTTPTITLGQLAGAAKNMGGAAQMNQAMAKAKVNMKQVVENVFKPLNPPTELMTEMETVMQIV
ncbi:hypothetical protein SeMB42_g05910 [Synchytrium endobioticum]|uniref:Uncharacterized protein n=1 Tax=Synchytrium endobioticum TaxID=286115 RepID=A0A507CNG1_9FUNG|nr:hypothetical protein SeMB42_g05910 [Synchytrium endobioticum]TPX45308.1 hypothetical protein SeLEV6574_g03940 [Synchytrium endobioticum]